MLTERLNGLHCFFFFVFSLNDSKIIPVPNMNLFTSTPGWRIAFSEEIFTAIFIPNLVRTYKKTEVYVVHKTA